MFFKMHIEPVVLALTMQRNPPGTKAGELSNWQRDNERLDCAGVQQYIQELIRLLHNETRVKLLNHRGQGVIARTQKKSVNCLKGKTPQFGSLNTLGLSRVVVGV